ncbi:hypothetical protein VTO42DRAFT_1470 [Malbranchea cinnamomea]
MNPYLSWAILLLIAGGLGWYYNGRSPSRTRVAPTRTYVEKSEVASTAKKPKRQPKKPRDVTSASATPDKQELRVNTSQTTSTAVDNEPESGMDNLQFAKEFSKVQNGSALSVASSSSGKKTQKKKTQRIKQGDSRGALTSASSTTGADADDDMSPVDWVQDTPVVSAGDVSDMLEPAAPAASVLRITGSPENEPVNKKKNKQKAENSKPTETKKQRQQRIKKENAKALVQEAEEQRRKLLEKQLHTVREHERRETAKFNTQPSNAWNTTPPAKQTNGVQQPVAASGGLLDTFDAESPPKVNGVAAQKEDSTPVHNGSIEQSWTQDLPSEEEQIRILSNLSSENEWTTVSSKKEKKKKNGVNKSGDNLSETNSETPSVKPNSKTTDKTSSMQPPPAPSDLTSALTATSVSTQKGHPLDSDWTA